MSLKLRLLFRCADVRHCALAAGDHPVVWQGTDRPLAGGGYRPGRVGVIDAHLQPAPVDLIEPALHGASSRCRNASRKESPAAVVSCTRVS